MKRSHADILDLAELAKGEFGMYANCTGSKDLLLKDSFGSVNGLTAQRAYNEGKNLYLGVSGKDSAQAVVLPVLYPAACRLLLESLPDFMPPFDEIKHKSVFISEGIVWRYRFIEGKHAMIRRIRSGTKARFFKDPNLLPTSHFISDASIDPESNFSRTLEAFQEFYVLLTGYDTHAPSFFPRKIMVICNKTELFNHLRILNLYHCFPMAGITSKQTEYINGTLPIDPLIMVASNYEAAREYILSHRGQFTIDYLIANGEDKVGRIRSQIKNDCANGIFSRYCLIGSQVILNDNNMALWHWDKKEEMKLRDMLELELVMEPTEDCIPLTEAVNDFYQCLSDINDEYGSTELFSEIKLDLYKILSDKLNEFGDFYQDLGNASREKTEKSLLSDNFDEEDFQEDLDRILNSLMAVHQAKMACPDYLDMLVCKISPAIPLVVRNSRLQTWKDGTLSKLSSQYQIIAYKDFIKEMAYPRPRSEYVFTFLPTLQQMVSMTNMMTKKKVSARMVLYPPELSILRSRLKKIRDWNRGNEGPKDATIFPNLNFSPIARETSEDLIERFEGQYSEDTVDLDMGGYLSYGTATCLIEAIDQKGSSVVISTPHKVLRSFDDDLELVLVTELETGDNILVYDNKSRESLYSILSEESEKFAKVNSYSLLWKRRLWEYVSVFTPSDENTAGNDERFLDPELLRKLSYRLGPSQDYIYNHWIKRGSSVYYPQKKMLDRVLAFLREHNLLSPDERDRIKSSRSFFVGVLISLGQNLSSETQQILLNKEDDLNGYIKRHVVDNSSRYPILSRFDADVIRSIIHHNYCHYTFVAIKDQEEHSDEA